MEANIMRKNLVAGYWSLLNRLDADIRIELITRLANSLAEDIIPKSIPAWKSLYGAWESEQEPEEMIRNIRNARLFDRKREAI